MSLQGPRPHTSAETAPAGLMSGTPLRRRDYAKLDEVGLDLVEEELSREGASWDTLARKYGVSAFNLRLWRRFRRTALFTLEIEPDQILDEISQGETLASIARKHDLSHALLQKWVAEKIPKDELEAAREIAPDAMFDGTKAELETAVDEVQLRRAIERHKIDRFVAERTTRRYTDERTMKIQPGSGVSFDIRFKRSQKDIEEDERTAEEAARP